MVDTETGELTESTLIHEGNAVRAFYAALEGPVVVGIEATGAMQWFLELLEELGIECRVGQDSSERDAPAEARSAGCTVDIGTANRRPLSGDLDALDRAAGLANFAARPTPVGEDANAMATQVAGDRTQSRPAPRPCTLESAGQSALQALPLPANTSQRRTELLSLYVQLQKRIQELDKEVEAQARQRLPARRLLTHPGVGPVTALATAVFLEQLENAFETPLWHPGSASGRPADDLPHPPITQCPLARF